MFHIYIYVESEHFNIAYRNRMTKHGEQQINAFQIRRQTALSHINFSLLSPTSGCSFFRNKSITVTVRHPVFFLSILFVTVHALRHSFDCVCVAATKPGQLNRNEWIEDCREENSESSRESIWEFKKQLANAMKPVKTLAFGSTINSYIVFRLFCTRFIVHHFMCHCSKERTAVICILILGIFSLSIWYAPPLCPK